MGVKKLPAPWLPATQRLLEAQKELGAQGQVKPDSQPNRGKDEEEVLAVQSSKMVCNISTSCHNQNEIEQFVNCIKDQAYTDIENFKAGQIKEKYQEWAELTSDKEILTMVSGYKLQFHEMPTQKQAPHIIKFNDEECEIINSEIDKLLQKEVVTLCDRESGDYISTVFIRPKKDNTFRMILNLKKFNEHLTYHHFKMDTIHTAIAMMRPNCYMASIDLKDVYYSVPIHVQDQKYLKFQWKNNCYKYTCFANGLSPCPRMFTKLLKPVYSILRQKGHELIGYLDDQYIQGDTVESCFCSVKACIELLRSLGFVIHPEKSALLPSQKLEFLGFILDSVSMTVSLTEVKKIKIKEECQLLRENKQPTIREVAHVIGLLVSAFPAVQFGPLYYRHLERDKSEAVKLNKGNFDKHMDLSRKALLELEWWEENVGPSTKLIYQSQPDIFIYTDASLAGWGAFDKSTNTKSGGEWLQSDKENMHINYLELKAVYFALQSFCYALKNVHVRFMVDNITAVAYIREMGGSKSLLCNEMAHKIWTFANERKIWISSAHLPGKLNTVADAESRKFNKELEWQLNPSTFKLLLAKLNFHCDIDLFASRLNNQLAKYVSYRPDPGSMAVDAFQLSWTNLHFYAFPPFSVIVKVLQKISLDKATGVIIVPYWPSQAFFPTLLHMLIADPVLIHRHNKLLQLTTNHKLLHPLRKKLNLLGCIISGNPLQQKTYQEKLRISSYNLGEQAHKNNTPATLLNGTTIVLNGKKIPLIHL